MPNPTQISLLDYHFEAKACNVMLTAMLNHSDIDYATVDELRDFNKLSCFTDDELHAALHELCKMRRASCRLSLLDNAPLAFTA